MEHSIPLDLHEVLLTEKPADQHRNVTVDPVSCHKGEVAQEEGFEITTPTHPCRPPVDLRSSKEKGQRNKASDLRFHWSQISDSN